MGGVIGDVGGVFGGVGLGGGGGVLGVLQAWYVGVSEVSCERMDVGADDGRQTDDLVLKLLIVSMLMPTPFVVIMRMDAHPNAIADTVADDVHPFCEVGAPRFIAALLGWCFPHEQTGLRLPACSAAFCATRAWLLSVLARGRVVAWSNISRTVLVASTYIPQFSLWAVLVRE